MVYAQECKLRILLLLNIIFDIRLNTRMDSFLCVFAEGLQSPDTVFEEMLTVRLGFESLVLCMTTRTLKLLS